MLLRLQLSTDGGKSAREYVFPHVTSNTVKRVPGTPAQARAATQTRLQASPTVLG